MAAALLRPVAEKSAVDVGSTGLTGKGVPIWLSAVILLSLPSVFPPPVSPVVPPEPVPVVPPDVVPVVVPLVALPAVVPSPEPLEPPHALMMALVSTSAGIAKQEYLVIVM